MSTRNNEDRTGAVPSEDTPVTTNTNAHGSGDAFSYVVPTEHVELPSEGKYYPEGHVLHKIYDSKGRRHSYFSFPS